MADWEVTDSKGDVIAVVASREFARMTPADARTVVSLSDGLAESIRRMHLFSAPSGFYREMLR